MKRFLAFTIVWLTLGIGMFFLGENVHASGKDQKSVNKGEHYLRNITVRATVSPSSVMLDTMESQIFTVTSNVSGPNGFQFNPGDGRGWSRVKHGDYSRTFKSYWGTLGRYTYRGSVTNEYYGPGIIDSGMARIVLK